MLFQHTGNNNILLRVISLLQRVLASLAPSFFYSDRKQTHKQTYFQGWENATMPLTVNMRARRREKKEERGEWGWRWDKVHQIWWHGDVDNVLFLAQHYEGRTTFTLSHSDLKRSTMYWICASNMFVWAQTPCPFTYQNDCCTIM